MRAIVQQEYGPHRDVLRLRASGKVLEPGAIANPVVLVANYLFDSIPQDLFSVEDGEIFAVTVSSCSTDLSVRPMTTTSSSLLSC